VKEKIPLILFSIFLYNYMYSVIQKRKLFIYNKESIS